MTTSANTCPECGGPREYGWGMYSGDKPPDFNDPNQGPKRCYACTSGYTAQEIRLVPHKAKRGIRKIPGAK